jgi:hypothetical protein
MHDTCTLARNSIYFSRSLLASLARSQSRGHVVFRCPVKKQQTIGIQLEAADLYGKMLVSREGDGIPRTP